MQFVKKHSFNIISIMGKGDKKTKRGKIIIGSFGIKRTRKPKKSTPSTRVNADLKTAADVEEQALQAARAAEKKTAKKAEETVVVAEEKPKAPKAKKKAADGETTAEAEHEVPAQE